MSKKSTAKTATSTSSLARWRKWIWRGGIATILVAAIVVGALSLRPKPHIVNTASARRGPMKVTIEASGYAHLRDRVMVSAPLAGSLPRLGRREGDAVKAGDALAEVMPLPTPLLNQQAKSEAQARMLAAQAAHRQAQSAAQQAKAALAFATEQANTHQSLADKGSLPKRTLERSLLEKRTAEQTLASTEFGVRVALHQMQVAKAAVGRIGGATSDEGFVISSPIDGIVLDVVADKASVVAPGTPLVEIADPGSMEVVVDLLTTEAVKLPERASASIVRWGGDETLPAHVHSIDPKAYPKLSALGVEERRVNVRLDLGGDASHYARLGDGFRVEAEIVLWEADDVLSIPDSALYKRDGRWHVFVVRDGLAAQREVEIGQQGAFRAEVRGGLREGDVVILHPGPELEEGMAVEAAN